MLYNLRELAMENNYEWQSVIGITIFAASWIGLSLLRRYLDKLARRKTRDDILKAYKELGDE